MCGHSVLVLPRDTEWTHPAEAFLLSEIPLWWEVLRRINTIHVCFVYTQSMAWRNIGRIEVWMEWGHCRVAYCGKHAKENIVGERSSFQANGMPGLVAVGFLVMLMAIPATSMGSELCH